jgi:hypothetical protein
MTYLSKASPFSLEEFFQPKEGTKLLLDCATQVNIVYRRAWIAILGAKKYGEVNDVPVSGFFVPGNYANTATSQRGLIPGDTREFHNPSAKRSHFENENTIYLGKGMFFAPGLGIKNAKAIEADLNELRRERRLFSIRSNARQFKKIVGYIDQTLMPGSINEESIIDALSK